MRIHFAFLLVLLAAPAGAEIFKCVRADGSTVFVSEPDNCASGAVAPHVPKGSFHAIERDREPEASPRELAAPPPTSPPPAAAAGASAGSEEALAAHWRRKRTEAERELDQVRANVVEWDKIATWCNRGGSLAVEDDGGGTKPYDCAEAIEAHATMIERQVELEHYLDEGLREECRRNDCLPGWIR
jgi:hypothetical protein